MCFCFQDSCPASPLCNEFVGNSDFQFFPKYPAFISWKKSCLFVCLFVYAQSSFLFPEKEEFTTKYLKLWKEFSHSRAPFSVNKNQLCYVTLVTARGPFCAVHICWTPAIRAQHFTQRTYQKCNDFSYLYWHSVCLTNNVISLCVFSQFIHYKRGWLISFCDW